MIEKDAKYVKRVVLFRLRKNALMMMLWSMSDFYNSHMSTFLLIYSNLLALTQSIDTPLCF
jgi:hypothetical protein